MAKDEDVERAKRVFWGVVNSVINRLLVAWLVLLAVAVVILVVVSLLGD